MADLFATGRIVDLIIALVVLEALTVLVLSRLAPRSMDFLALLPTLASGLLLLLALRAAIAGLGWQLIAAPLALALIAHLVDLRVRWRRR
jgi:hypothetical protein